MRAAAFLLLGLLVVGAAAAPLALSQTSQSRAPQSLAASVIPTSLPADGGTYQALVISLVDGNQNPTLSVGDIKVYLSTNDPAVVTVPKTAVLPAGVPYIVVGVTTTPLAGDAVLSVTAPGLTTAIASVTTVGTVLTPTFLRLFVAPLPTVEALQSNDAYFAVQVEGAGGPALTSQSTSVVITCTNNSVVEGSVNVTLPAGTDLMYGNFHVATWGKGTLTALSHELGTSNAFINVKPSDIALTITFTPPIIENGGVSTVTVSVRVLGMPVPNATIALSVSVGSLISSNQVTNDTGDFTTKYISAVPGIVTVSAFATSTVTGSLRANGTIIVSGPMTTTTQALTGLLPTITGLVWTYIPLIVVAVVVIVGLVLVRRTIRKSGSPSDEEGYEAVPPDVKS